GRVGGLDRGGVRLDADTPTIVNEDRAFEANPFRVERETVPVSIAGVIRGVAVELHRTEPDRDRPRCAVRLWRNAIPDLLYSPTRYGRTTSARSKRRHNKRRARVADDGSGDVLT